MGITGAGGGGKRLIKNGRDLKTIFKNYFYLQNIEEGRIYIYVDLLSTDLDFLSLVMLFLSNFTFLRLLLISLSDVNLSYIRKSKLKH